jgi:hypothetical protein
MIPTPPKRLLLGDVPRYIRTRYGHDVPRITVYGWVKHGRKGVKLKLLPDKGQNPNGGRKAQLTMSTYVDQFLRDTQTRIV